METSAQRHYEFTTPRIVRSVCGLILRRPVVAPAWTPGLFFGGALVALLVAAGQVGNSA